jgi:4-amino-4-deoxy-L-arabinose transferase-like glycosyltransferase
MTNSVKNRFFLISVIFLHLSFFLWQFFHGNYFLKDSFEYLQATANLKSDFLLYCGDLTKPLNYELFTKRPPVYPLFLAACQLVSTSLIFVLILQNLFSIAGIYLVRQMLLKYGYSAKYDLLFIILLLVTPSQFIYANLIMSETLLQFLIILMVWFFVKYLNERRHIYGLFYTAILSLCVLTKPVFVYFVFVNVLCFLWISIKRATAKPLLISLIPLILLLTYQYRNYRQTGVFEASSIVTINLLDYNAYFFLVKTHGQQAADSAILNIDSLSKVRGTYKEEIAFKKQQATAIIMKQPVSYALFHTEGIAGFFLDPGRFDLVNFFNLKSEKINGLLYQINKVGLKGALAFLVKHTFVLLLFLTLIFLFNTFKFLCFVFFIIRLNSNKYLKGFVLFLILYVAFLTGPLGASRFMMPLLPLYIGCCLLFLSNRKIRHSRHIV